MTAPPVVLGHRKSYELSQEGHSYDLVWMTYHMWPPQQALSLPGLLLQVLKAMTSEGPLSDLCPESNTVLRCPRDPVPGPSRA